jgi:hypothetical protein
MYMHEIPRRTKGGCRAVISTREILVAWACCGAIALGVGALAPGDPCDAPTIAAAPIVDAASRDPSLDGFEDAADRAAALAGTDAAPAAEPARSRVATQHVAAHRASCEMSDRPARPPHG